MSSLKKYLIIFLFAFFCFQLAANALIQDELVDETLKDKTIKNPYVQYKYNFEDTKRILIELKVIADINSEKDVKEGQTVVLRSCYDVWSHGRKVLRKNELVYAKVETIITSGMNGIPASIILGSFKFDNIDSNKVTSTYEVYGQDRSLLVFPLKWALTILPPTGTLTNFIKGGHARLKENDTVELYFYPNW